MAKALRVHGGDSGPCGVRQEATSASGSVHGRVSGGQRQRTGVDHICRATVLHGAAPSSPALHDPDGPTSHRPRTSGRTLLLRLVAGSGPDHHQHTAAVGGGHPGQLATPPVPRVPGLTRSRKACPNNAAGIPPSPTDRRIAVPAGLPTQERPVTAWILKSNGAGADGACRPPPRSGQDRRPWARKNRIILADASGPMGSV